MIRKRSVEVIAKLNQNPFHRAVNKTTVNLEDFIAWIGRLNHKFIIMVSTANGTHTIHNNYIDSTIYPSF